MDISVLEDLGLSHSEIKVYLALLGIGSGTAGTLLDACTVQNSVLHRALHSLISKGLVNYVRSGKRKIYQATDPETFYSYIDEKRRRFQQILPELKKKQHTGAISERATVYSGVRGITEIYATMLRAKGKEYNTFGGGVQCVQRMGIAWWENLHKKRIALHLPSRQVFDETVRPFAGGITANPLTRIRFLSKEFASFQETVIVGNRVAINVFTENPYGFLMEDENVAESYRKYFEILWNISKR